MTKSFNPKDWLDVPKEQPKPTVSNKATTKSIYQKKCHTEMNDYWNWTTKVF